MNLSFDNSRLQQRHHFNDPVIYPKSTDLYNVFAMHLNDLIDTVLVARKEEPHSATPSSSTGSGANTTAAPAKSQTTSTMNNNNTAPSGGDVCPVDHKTREIWLQQARASGASTPNPHEGMMHPPNLAAQAQQPAPSASTASSSSSWSPWTWFSSSTTSSPQTPHQQHQPSQSQPPHPLNPDGTLDTTRTISSIPRSSSPGPSACPAPQTTTTTTTATTPPPNHERDTGSDPATGNWIYPSEKMFFDAMRRKGFTDTQVGDMKTVVPIHNAVNERAWAEIKTWEAPYAGECAAGPRLHSFAGVKERMTPRARMRTLLGYTAPFDRHDWVVDRCGKRVEYVIDFYAGRPDKGEGKVNFYLDVRPKVNSWEGIKMRALRGVGLA